MNLDFEVAEINEANDYLTEVLMAWPSAVDSFVETHLIQSQHSWLTVNGHRVGLASVLANHMLTFFDVKASSLGDSQALFREFRVQKSLDSAWVPSCAEAYLSLALDDFQSLEKQSYIFQASPSAPNIDTQLTLNIECVEPDELFELMADLEFAALEDTFGDIEQALNQGALYRARADDQRSLGYGFLEAHPLTERVSLGLFVSDKERGRGYGGAMARALKDHALARGLELVAGCWYGHEASKKVLERAGFTSRSRLLRIKF